MRVLQLLGEPIKSFVEPVATRRACSLDIPIPVSEGVEVQFVCDLSRIHCIG